MNTRFSEGSLLELLEADPNYYKDQYCESIEYFTNVFSIKDELYCDEETKYHDTCFVGSYSTTGGKGECYCVGFTIYGTYELIDTDCRFHNVRI